MRYDLISPRPRKDGKTYWHKIGAAFPRDKGGFSLVFDSLPLPDAEGRVSVLMSEPLEDGKAAPSGYGDKKGAPSPYGDKPPATRSALDDEIPF